MFDDKEKLKESLKIFEEVAYEYLSNNLMRFHAKNIFFKCVLLFLLLDDDIGASTKLEKYQDDDPSLNNCFEARYLKKLIETVKSSDEEEFQKNNKELNARINMDKHLTITLLQIKKKLIGTDNPEEEYNPL